MTNKPTSHRYSIDGFVPNSPNRHVGFQPNPPKLDNRLHRVPARRPGLHSTQPPLSPVRPTAHHPHSVAAPAQRQSFPEFTTYRQPGERHAIGTSLEKREENIGVPRHRQTRRERRKTQKSTEKRSLWQRLRRAGWKKNSKRISLAFGVLALLGAGWLGWKLFFNANKAFGNGNIIGFLNATPLKGEDKGRVNILLGGVSSDDPGHDGANLTDSIMLVSLDTRNHNAFMMSIPRDLWVNIPGYGHTKINAANAYGDQNHFSENGYTKGGMGLLEKTISENFQIPIQYYAKINYTAFRDAVNAVGGVHINIQSEDPRGLYDPNISRADKGPLKLPNGWQTLNGQTALNLARARGDPCNCGRYEYGFPRSDFDRTEHQRQLLLGLKDKVTSASVISNPLKIGSLLDALGNNVKTDFKPSEIRRLYDLSKQIDNKGIISVGLNDADGKNLLMSYTSSDGASALAPAAGLDNYSQIQLYLKKIMTNDPVVKESASVVVLNGGDIDGLASKEANILNSKGMNVVAVGTAPATQKATLIVNQSKGKKPATEKKLQELFGAQVTTKNTLNDYTNADFIIVLGKNVQMPQ